MNIISRARRGHITRSAPMADPIAGRTPRHINPSGALALLVVLTGVAALLGKAPAAGVPAACSFCVPGAKGATCDFHNRQIRDTVKRQGGLRRG